MCENWLPVVGYEGLYEVSDQGRVKRVKRDLVDSLGKIKSVPEMIMKEVENNCVILCKDSKYSNLAVRSLVAEAFLNVPHGTSLTHLDRDPSNSKLSNLMLTSKYRMLDSDWKDIPGWEGLYQASRFGQIRSLDRYIVTARGTYRFLQGTIRSMDESSDGYYQVCLYDGCNKRTKTTNAHIFVAQAWIPNPENKPTVNHIDGNKKNNCIENLEWATYEEQQEHAVRTGLRQKSYWDVNKHGPVGGDWNESRQIRVRCIETGVEYPSFSAAAEAFGTGASEIKLSVDGHKVCRGVHFVKADEPDYSFGATDLEDEVWKDIPGFEGLYAISNKMRVKSLQRIVKTSKGQRTAPEKVINTSGGYASLNKNNKASVYRVNTLYSQTFGTTKTKQLINLKAGG